MLYLAILCIHFTRAKHAFLRRSRLEVSLLFLPQDKRAREWSQPEEARSGAQCATVPSRSSSRRRQHRLPLLGPLAHGSTSHSPREDVGHPAGTVCLVARASRIDPGADRWARTMIDERGTTVKYNQREHRHNPSLAQKAIEGRGARALAVARIGAMRARESTRWVWNQGRTRTVRPCAG
jgi:hypothetical protein